MEKYEIIKWLEIFDKRIKDIKEVLNIDQISSQIKLYEEQMLEEGFWDKAKEASNLTQKNNNLKDSLNNYNQLIKEYEDLAMIVELNDATLFLEAEDLVTNLDKKYIIGAEKIVIIPIVKLIPSINIIEPSIIHAPFIIFGTPSIIAISIFSASTVKYEIISPLLFLSI